MFPLRHLIFNASGSAAPAAQPATVASSSSASSSGSATPATKRPEDADPWLTAKRIACGSGAGAITKTCIAPLERIKVLHQTQGMHVQAGAKAEYTGIIQTVRVILQKVLCFCFISAAARRLHESNRRACNPFVLPAVFRCVWFVPRHGDCRLAGGMDASVERQ
jgi:hypothetical protein